MTKQKKSVQRYGYFQAQMWPLPELERQAERWWRTGQHYLQVVWIDAASFTEAATLVEQQAGAWYGNAGVELLVSPPVRPCASGDVLCLEDPWGKRWAWMRWPEGWVALAIPEDTPVRRYQLASSTKTVACSYDGGRVVVNDRDDLIRLYSAARPDCLTYARHRGDVRSLAWSPDGTRVASGDWQNELHIWQVYEGTGKARHQAETRHVLICLVEQPYNGEQITALAWSPDSRYVATGSNHGFLRVWDAAMGRCIWTQVCRTQQAVRGIAWSPDRCFLFTGSADGVVQVWHVEEQQRWNQFHLNGLDTLSGLVCSPDGKLLALSDGASQRLVLADSGGNEQSDIALPTYGLQKGVLSLAFSPDGRFVVAGCTDSSLQIVDMGQRQTVHIYHGHSGRVNTVAWSMDGGRIVSGGQDKLAQVWDVPQALSPLSLPPLLSVGEQKEE